MHLKDYEQFKSELAEIIRVASTMDSANKRDPDQRWQRLLTRLADDRFNIVLAGRFNRGKSSLMNALFGLDRLPTGIVPLTSVITTVRYGTSERVLLEYDGSGLRGEAPLEDLAEYVTEKGNPGNQRRIRSAEIQLPVEILRRGFHFVDTPGLASAIVENSKTTERFIPEIDVLILVTSYESPLTEDEIRFLQQTAPSVRATFVAINKQDVVAPEARHEVLEYVSKSLNEALGGTIASARIFSVSARDGLKAKQAGDADALRSSGIVQFERGLIQFLTAEKTNLFLGSMCDRMLAELEARVPQEALADLAEKVRALQRKIGRSLTPTVINDPSAGSASTIEKPGVAQRIASCEICAGVMKRVFDFLRRYQYELSIRPEVQREHADNGGFCALHTWHYEQIASPRGVCTGYPALLKQAATRLRELASIDGQSATRLLESRCLACKLRWETEDRMIGSILARAGQAENFETFPLSAICLPHLQEILKRTDDSAFRKHVLSRQAALLERTAEDMQRYAIRVDALRRWLVSEEERDAPLRALQLLVGHRNVNALFAVRDTL